MKNNKIMPLIAIVMATYNGEKYIREQLDSILWQTYENWKLYIRDDGSTDKTVKIIEEYAMNYPDKILIIKESNKNYGVCNNFFYTLGFVKEEYVMFCDQDDVWLKEKIEVTARRMFSVERKNKNIPILVHTDAIVTTEELEPVNYKINRKAIFSIKQMIPLKRAYYSRFHDKKTQTTFANLLLKNSVQGMTIMINRNMSDYLQRLSEGKLPTCIYHDSLIASVASIVGVIEFYPAPTVLYRQHTNNNAGAFSYIWTIFCDMEWSSKLKRVRLYNYLTVNREKISVLRKLYHEEMTDRQMKILNFFRNTPNDWEKFRELGLEKEFTCKQRILMRIFKIQ